MTENRRTALRAVLVSIMILCAAGARLPMAHAAYSGGTVTVSTQEPETLDPARIKFTSEYGMVSQVFEGLVEFDAIRGTIVPCLATSWEILDEGRRYVFHLKEGVRFHNGKPLTSADFRHTLERFLKYSQLDFLPDLIKGGPAFKAGKAKAIEGLATPDPLTVVLTLERPVGFLLPALASVLVTPDESDGSPVDWNAPPGTGPFMVGERKKGEHLDLVRNPNYHQPGLPYLDRVRVTAPGDDEMYEFTKGRLTAVGLPYGEAADWMSDGYYRSYVKITREPGINYINLNTRKAPFNNRLVRQALNHLLDPSAAGMQEGAEFTRLGGLLSPDMPGFLHTVKPYAFDLEKARTLLAQAGHKGGTGIPRITLLVPNPSLKGFFDAAWGENLKKAGIKYASANVSWGDMDARIAKGDFVAAVCSWAPDYMDPDAMFHSLMHPSSRNCIAFSFPEVTALIEKGRAATDPGERKAIYDNLQITVRDLAPMIFGWSETRYYLVDPTMVGWEKSPSSEIPAMKHVWSDRPRSWDGSKGTLPPSMTEAMRALGDKDWDTAKRFLAETGVNYPALRDGAAILRILVPVAKARAEYASGLQARTNPNLRGHLMDIAFEEQFLDLPKGPITLHVPDFAYEPIPWGADKDLDPADRYLTGLITDTQREFMAAIDTIQGKARQKQLSDIPPAIKAGPVTVKSAHVYALLAETYAQSRLMPDLVLWLMDQAIGYAEGDKPLADELKKRRAKLEKEVAKW